MFCEGVRFIPFDLLYKHFDIEADSNFNSYLNDLGLKVNSFVDLYDSLRYRIILADDDGEAESLLGTCGVDHNLDSISHFNNYFIDKVHDQKNKTTLEVFESHTRADEIIPMRHLKRVIAVIVNLLNTKARKEFKNSKLKSNVKEE